MKIALYIFLGLMVLAGLLFGFVYTKMQIPELVIPVGASEQEKMEYVDQWFSNLEKKGKFNGGVLVAKAGEQLLMKAYGYTDFTKKEGLSPQSSFRLASVSKQFTAAGLMVLRERGLLHYDDLVAKYLKDFPYEEVSIRQLLNQTSGVPDVYMSLAEKHKKEVGDTLSIAEAVQLVCKYPKSPAASPGEVYAYSNTNYILLAGLIETISKQTFEAFLQEQLFDPLGMKNTRVWNLLSPESDFPNKTSGFGQFGRTKAVLPSWLDGVAGDGAVFCSLEDFLIWDQFWYANEQISAENLAEAFKKPILKNGTESDYGFGWVLNGDVVWHNGAWLAAKAMIIRNTKTKSCLVVLDNSSNLGFDKILVELRKLNN